jgi:hypothetical protein
VCVYRQVWGELEQAPGATLELDVPAESGRDMAVVRVIGPVMLRGLVDAKALVEGATLVQGADWAFLEVVGNHTIDVGGGGDDLSVEGPSGTVMQVGLEGSERLAVRS